MQWDLEGKGAIVTGAGSGIGRAVALRLGQSGVAVGVVDLDASRAEASSREIQKLGVKAIGLAVDAVDGRLKILCTSTNRGRGSL